MCYSVGEGKLSIELSNCLITLKKSLRLSFATPKAVNNLTPIRKERGSSLDMYTACLT
jgi:hypothetical protein